MEHYCYFSLRQKTDNKEVYTSIDYKRDGSDVTDYERVGKTLKYYFDRVNSGIQQQLESPRLTEEQKKELKLLDVSDYNVAYVQNKELGAAQKIYWTRDASIYID